MCLFSSTASLSGAGVCRRMLGVFAFFLFAVSAFSDDSGISLPNGHIIAASGRTDPRMVSFDRRMGEFMERHEVPGAALAVTDHGRLVYARGFGFGETETKDRVEPTSLFRIASLSKPITAVAVLQLAEQGRLSLDDRVFDLLNWSELAEEKGKFDERLKSVTVRHLLEHRGGWDRDVSFDPMFQSVRFALAENVAPPAGPETIIRCMFGERLDFDPGERYAYSNYGYCLLGRIIEKVSGRTYEEYVKEHVLQPLGIRSMAIGRTRLAGRHEGEVRYYDSGTGKSVFADNLNEPVSRPYGAWYLEAMDAHGGWIASAVDLARFVCAFDEPAKCPILSGASIRTMYARPVEEAGGESDGAAEPVYYSCGWLNRVVGEGELNHWHNGSLPGTSTLIVRRHDGRNWVILFNTRSSPHGVKPASAVDRVLHRAANEVVEWPEYDLFADLE